MSNVIDAADAAALLATLPERAALDQSRAALEQFTDALAREAIAQLNTLSAQRNIDTVVSTAKKRKFEELDASDVVEPNKRQHVAPIDEIVRKLKLYPHQVVPTEFFHVGGIYLCYHKGTPNTQDFAGHYRVKLIEKTPSSLVFQYLDSTGDLLQGPGQQVTKTFDECRLWNIIPLRWDPTLSEEETTPIEDIIDGLADTPHRFTCLLDNPRTRELTGITTGYSLV